MKNVCNKGFTMVELLIVMAIIAALAAIAIPSYSKYVQKTKIAAAVSVLDALRKDLYNYSNEKGSYPKNINFAEFLDQDGNNVLETISMQSLNTEIASWESYVLDGNSYILKVKAKDSDRTLMILTPRGMIY